MNIVLLGYMASGKSTIGQLLAKKENRAFYDLDDYISQKEGMTVPEIFAQKGELYFRKKEHFFLKELIEHNKNCVISLGGGTPCYGNNLALINHENTGSVYLKASLKTLTERLLIHKENRPLIAFLEDEQVSEFIAKHLFERQFFYEQAQKTIVVDHKTETDIVEEISELYK